MLNVNYPGDWDGAGSGECEGAHLLWDHFQQPWLCIQQFKCTKYKNTTTKNTKNTKEHKNTKKHKIQKTKALMFALSRWYPPGQPGAAAGGSWNEIRSKFKSY